MRVSVERLRIWLLAGAALLVLVVAGFLGLAQWRAHRFLTDLPAKLGVDVRQETNAFTYSQTVKGRTAYTLHAAKAIQHNDGKYTLHDVGIAVYGQDHVQGKAGQAGDEKQSERVDRIYGKEFDLDQTAGMVKAVGEVHLDLQAPAATDAKGKMDYAAGTDLKSPGQPAQGPAGAGDNSTKARRDEAIHEVAPGNNKLIHVKTSNLVYQQKIGMAATDEEIQFEYNGLAGHAVGAKYTADSGILTLQAAVKVSGLEHGQPILLTASKAELERLHRRVTMSDAKYLTVSGSGDSSKARQTVEAKHAVVLMRDGGGVERINGEGAVTVAAGDDMRVSGDRGEVMVNEAGKPVSAHITGNVQYTADDESRHAKGSSSEATVAFDKEGHAEHVVLNGSVNLTEHVLMVASVAKPGAKDGAKEGPNDRWSDRELSAQVVDMGLDTDAAGRSRPRDAKASGGARLRVVDGAANGKGSSSNSMAADVLTAQFIVGGDGASRLDEVKGRGRTVLQQVSETGVIETSSGDALEIRFRDAAAKGTAKKSPGFEGSSVASAVQQGNVVVTRKTPAKDGGQAQVDRSTAERADYDGDAQTLALSGQVQLTNAEGVLWAERVLVEQKSGDASAEGGVKASYRQDTQGETVHVLADRAELKKASGVAVFHGGLRKPARLWQSGSQVEAPVLEFNQKQRSLLARGEGAGAPMAVRTVLVSAGGTGAATGAEQAPGEAKVKQITRGSSVVRVTSREMTYSDASREVDFTGGVRVESPDGMMRGDHASAFLEAAGQKKDAPKQPEPKAGFLGGSVERVTVNGGIEIDQPGRRATGDRLVYTAGDGLFVLTGTPSSPPRVVDQARGAVTGVELRFRAADESVVISNGERGGSGPRVHTETRVKKDR